MDYVELREKVAVILSGGATQMTAADLSVIIGEVSDRVDDLGRRIGDEVTFISDPTASVEDGADAQESIRTFEIELAKLRTALSQLTALRDQRQREETASQRSKAEAAARTAYDTAMAALLSEIRRLPDFVAALNRAKAAHKVAYQLGVVLRDPQDDFGGHIREFQIMEGVKQLIADHAPGRAEQRAEVARAKAEKIAANREAFEIERAARERVSRQMVEDGRHGPLDAGEIAAAKAAIRAERSARQLPPLPTQEKAA